MKIEFKDASGYELKELLRMMLISKFCPDERTFMIPHPAIKEVIESAIKEYILLVGEDEYQARFFRSNFGDQDKTLLAGTVLYFFPNIPYVGKEKVIEKLEELALPVILSAEFLEDTYKKACEIYLDEQV